MLELVATHNHVNAPRRAIGHLLLNFFGDVCASDDRVEALFLNLGPFSDEMLERIFPERFRPRELVRAANGAETVAPEIPCKLSLSAERSIPVLLKLDRIGSWWLLEILESAPSHSVVPFLAECLLQQDEIARYLHNTVSQCMVALSLSLTRLQGSPGSDASPLVARAFDLCENGSRDLRVVNAALASSVSIRPKPDSSDIVASLKWYIRNLRQDPRLDVSFHFIGNSPRLPVHVGRHGRTLLRAFLQRWAATAMNSRIPTQILLLQSPLRLELRILTEQPDDPAIAAVLASSLLGAAARELGTRVQPLPGHVGASACLMIADRAEADGDEALIMGAA